MISLRSKLLCNQAIKQSSNQAIKQSSNQAIKRSPSFTLIHLFCVLLLVGCPDAGQQSEQAVKPDKGKEVKPAGGGTKPAPYSFTFGVESHKAQFKEGATYTGTVVETNKPTGDKRDITYTSSAPAIATVDSTGEVTFVSQGTVTITASKALDGDYPKVTASYILHLSTFAFEKASHKVEFRKGGTYTGAVVETNKPTGDKRDITYTSSDPAIATVDSTGQVTFVSQGTVTITASKALDGDYPKVTASYILHLFSTFAFEKASHKVEFRKGGTYTGTVVETNKPTGDKRDITYTSSAPAIATVDSTGEVTFVSQGTVTITATKAAQGEYAEAAASYILYLTMKPMDRDTLMAEIKRAMDTHGNTVDLNYIDTTAITIMAYIFSKDLIYGKGLHTFNGNISKWDVSKVTNMYSMFNGATSFNQDISEWKVGKVTDMKFMFEVATSFNQDVSDWDVSKVTDMRSMFNGATSFNQDISDWEVGNVTNMSSMFRGATSFNQDISEWKVGKVTDMRYMFQGATSFNQDISDWDVSLVTDMDSMFNGATSFNQDISEWKVGKVTDMSYMFHGATSFNQDISDWEVGNVTDMSYMFQDATRFTQNLNAWRTRINAAIKAGGWGNAERMFIGSGLKNNPPAWCRDVPACSRRQV